MAEYVHYVREKGPRVFKFGKYSFSTIEIQHLAIALLMLTITFMFIRGDFITNFGYVTSFLIFAFIVGTSFLFHEFGHKLVAQHYGFMSEFRADFMWMGISLAMAIAVFFFGFGIVFIAPGAVLILGRVTRRQNGIISVAGPVVNLVLAVIFLLLLIAFQSSLTTLTYSILALGIYLNAFLGVFNMLPFWILDGKKVYAWDKAVYFLVMGLLLLILFGHTSLIASL